MSTIEFRAIAGQYLRILRRYLEHGESVPYESRLDV